MVTLYLTMKPSLPVWKPTKAKKAAKATATAIGAGVAEAILLLQKALPLTLSHWEHLAAADRYQ